MSGTDALVIRVPLGRRVMVMGDLALPDQPTASSTASSRDVGRALDRWEGPGIVVLCGKLLARVDDAAQVRAALDAHPHLVEAVRKFLAGPQRRIVVVDGPSELGSASQSALGAGVAELGIDVAIAVDLHLATGEGTSTVHLRTGRRIDPSVAQVVEPPVPDAVEATDPAVPRPWLVGVDKLEDPGASSRFVTSRLVYRRIGRVFAVVGLLPALAVVLVRIRAVLDLLNETVGGAPAAHRALARAYTADWADRFLVALLGAVGAGLVLAVVVTLASRATSKLLSHRHPPGRWWDRRFDNRLDADPLDNVVVGGRPARDAARMAIASGAAGLIVAGSARAELTHVDPGFFGCPGASTELVREHRGRLGLPAVFTHHRQSSWIELETGANLHVRLVAAEGDLSSSTFVERLAAARPRARRQRIAPELHPELVASWPRGPAWPPAPDSTNGRRRVRSVRRVAAGAILGAGLFNLLDAVTPPLRGHLRLVAPYLPIGVVQAAGALVALAGIGLMMLARGVRLGQRRSWLVSVCILGATVGLHLARETAVAGIVVAAGVLALLIVERERFRGATDAGSARSALTTLVVGSLTAIGAASLAVEIEGAVHRHTLPSWPLVLLAAAERLVGVRAITLPDGVDDWIAPSLLAVGIALAVVVLALLTRPAVERRASTTSEMPRRRAEHRARDIVRRHGTGTLDYFALRDDKQWFFHRDSLVAYAVYGGVCIVSPDPIGPRSERAQVWEAFRRYADRHSWAVGVMAASEEWLVHYRDSGMGTLYIGDEAVVDVTSFSLSGGKMKGLRQAVARIRRNGYAVRFVDPSRLDPRETEALLELMGRNRRGENERGFSMSLGRVFEPRDSGLLMTVVTGPDGAPVAVCQFVPAPAIGGYSLDLMRRDPGDHPNGLLDFALVSTIDHLRERGMLGLSLNFATMRSLLDGENGDGLTQRVERWALRRLSGALQIESLWRFNDKYEPAWLPRYIVWDAAEHFVPTVVQILRAESLTDIPVVGRLLVSQPRPLAS
jgi:lysylphosphatidylglycerol synthetase-like protein (DUF2156 family)